MTDQLELFRPVPAARLSTRSTELENEARKFVAAHPEIWRLFLRFTHELIGAGREHYSSDAVLHRIRWYTAVESHGEEFKVNNNFSAVFARWFHDAYPERAGFFRTRQRVSEHQRPRGIS
jgi:hypothetical protein